MYRLFIVVRNMILTEQDTVPRSGVRTINDCNSKRGSGGCKTHSTSESAGECKYVFLNIQLA